MTVKDCKHTSSDVRMCTAGGGLFDFGHPEVEQINRADIAWALALICRFNGHIRHFYSVGQHSLNCFAIAKARSPENYALQLGCLLHDAHEAYLGDITRPVRKFLSSIYGIDWEAITKRLDVVILQALSLPEDLCELPEVKVIDQLMLDMEAYHFGLSFGSGKPSAEREFCDLFESGPSIVRIDYSAALNECLAKFHGVA